MERKLQSRLSSPNLASDSQFTRMRREFEPIESPRAYWQKRVLGDKGIANARSAIALAAVMASGGALIGWTAIKNHLDLSLRSENKVVKTPMGSLAKDINKAYSHASPSHSLATSGSLMLKAIRHARIAEKNVAYSLPHFLLLVHENANAPKSAIAPLRAKFEQGKASAQETARLSALEFIHDRGNAKVMMLVRDVNKGKSASALKKELSAMVARNLVESIPSKR